MHVPEHLDPASRGSARLSVQFVAPYLRQRTDHESIVEGYSSFAISSLEVGDLAATVSGVFVGPVVEGRRKSL
jgi:hypothetical protein